jgi:hypothetical protein
MVWWWDNLIIRVDPSSSEFQSPQEKKMPITSPERLSQAKLDCHGSEPVNDVGLALHTTTPGFVSPLLWINQSCWTDDQRCLVKAWF